MGQREDEGLGKLLAKAVEEGDGDLLAAALGKKRVAELEAASERLSTKLAKRRGEANATGYGFAFLQADLTHEQVATGIVDRKGWEAGPWDNEPDQVMWVAKDPPHFRCMVWRHDANGQLNGYVAVPKDHPAWGRDYGEIDVDVHGGLTFAGRGIDDSWVFGFDTSHGFDVCPGMEATMRSIGIGSPMRFGGGEYRQLAYVRGEVESLARQLAAWIPPRLPAGEDL